MAANSEIVLLQTKDLADGESRAVVLPAEAGGYDGFVVRQGDEIFGYINRCPHTGAPLDWSPDQFLNADRSYIICAMHGALFEIDTGRCVAGPCVDQLLHRLDIKVADGRVVLLTPPHGVIY